MIAFYRERRGGSWCSRYKQMFCQLQHQLATEHSYDEGSALHRSFVFPAEKRMDIAGLLDERITQELIIHSRGWWTQAQCLGCKELMMST